MKKRRQSLFLQKVIPIIGFVVMVYTLFSLSKVVWRNYQIEKETQDLKEEIGVLEEENQHLLNLIVYFKTDVYKEKEARKRLGYKKPGEEVILVPSVKDKTDPDKDFETGPGSNWKLWWDFFFS
ncbi:septum formation initiator family protein [Patescibacteria group bacterium]